MTDPEVYGDTGVFGSYWTQPKDEKYCVEAYEKALLEYVRYYIKEVEQRRWYGFWDYGDVMHTYDPIRHCWRYDVGGLAEYGAVQHLCQLADLPAHRGL